MADKNFIIKRVQTKITMYPVKCRRSQIPDYICKIGNEVEEIEGIEAHMFINDKDNFQVYEDTGGNPYDKIVDMNDKEDREEHLIDKET